MAGDQSRVYPASTQTNAKEIKKAPFLVYSAKGCLILKM